MKELGIFFLLNFFCLATCRQNSKYGFKTEEASRDKKILPIFQIVKFPNDPCVIAGGTKNGTCYTSEECSNKGGVNTGSCAQGFGVCCTFTMSCGSTSSENCTYFEASALGSGACRSKICPCSSNICQMRLDFNSFVITGPSTSTVTVFKAIGGVASSAGKEANQASTCATDTFGVTNAPNLPNICGTLTGEHVYFEASDDCHDLAFSFGQTGIGTTIPANRQFSIKVTQYSCDYDNLAPQGCDQYYFGDTSGQIQSFNYDNMHLADQHQNICIRREANNCKICYSANAITDVQLSGMGSMGYVKHSLCCSYGVDGMKTEGYDCIMIPGAAKNTASSKASPATICGSGGGLVSATGVVGKTVCTKSMPFRLDFYSDGIELQKEAAKTQKGFSLKYFQTGC